LFEEKSLQDNSFIPLIRHLSKRFGLSRPIIIADAAMLSKNAINALEEAHYEYILDVEPKHETEDIRQNILNLELKDGNTAEIPKDGNCRLIVSKSPECTAMDRLKRERGLQRLQQKIKSGFLSYESINNRGYNKYLKLKGKTKVAIDNDKCRIDAVWDGITGYLTNSKLRPDEIMENYNNFRFVKQAFRINKPDLLIRPVYHDLQNRIEALVCICFTAYTILLDLDRQLKMSGSVIPVKKVQEITYSLYRIAHSREIKKHIQNMDKQQAELCRIVENAGN
jgi:transposase